MSIRLASRRHNQASACAFWLGAALITVGVHDALPDLKGLKVSACRRLWL